jgi:hypothetical protein
MVQGWGRTSTEVLPVFDGTDRYARAGSLVRARGVFLSLRWIPSRGLLLGQILPSVPFPNHVRNPKLLLICRFTGWQVAVGPNLSRGLFTCAYQVSALHIYPWRGPFQMAKQAR